MAAVKLNTTLIIVIAASGLIGCVIILFSIFRCFRRPKSAPLPPIQPLAHHREKEFDHPPHLHIHRSSVGLAELGRYGSDASLLKPSFQTDEPNGTPSSSHYLLSIPPSPSANAIYQSGLLSVDSQSNEPASNTQQYVSTTRLARSASRARQPRSCRNSIASTYSTPAQASTRSLSTIRGAPHSTLSNVQIVLPTPLAPQLRNHMVTNLPAARSYEDLVERGSIVDGWTTAPGRSTSRRSNSYSLGQRISSISGHRYHRSLDTMDQPRRSESQAQFRGRSPSTPSNRPQTLDHGDTAPSSRSMNDQTQPPRAVLRKPRDEQGNSINRPLRYFPLNLLNPQPNSHPLEEETGPPAVQEPTHVLGLGRDHVPATR